jgi:hypothetical protein
MIPTALKHLVGLELKTDLQGQKVVTTGFRIPMEGGVDGKIPAATSGFPPGKVALPMVARIGMFSGQVVAMKMSGL